LQAPVTVGEAILDLGAETPRDLFDIGLGHFRGIVFKEQLTPVGIEYDIENARLRRDGRLDDVEAGFVGMRLRARFRTGPRQVTPARAVWLYSVGAGRHDHFPMNA
jgi:hypothetical protein